MTRLATPAALFVGTIIAIAPSVIAQTQASHVKLTAHETRIDVSIDGKPFTTYHFDEKGDPKFARPYFFPVLAPDGTPLTSDQAIVPNGDHPHHRSFYVSHGDVNGADHWSLQHGDKQPRQRHVAIEKVNDDTIVERLEWESADRQSILLKETRTLRFFQFDDEKEGIARGVDVTVALTPARTEPVFLNDTKEAGLCAVRLAKALADTGTITHSDGKTGEKDTWGKPAAWCDLSGRINDKPYGVAVFDHPANPRHPTRWHVRQYGLIAANAWGLSAFDKSPAGTGKMQLASGVPTIFRYRVVFHAGDAKAAKLEEKYAKFSKE